MFFRTNISVSLKTNLFLTVYLQPCQAEWALLVQELSFCKMSSPESEILGPVFTGFVGKKPCDLNRLDIFGLLGVLD